MLIHAKEGPEKGNAAAFCGPPNRYTPTPVGKKFFGGKTSGALTLLPLLWKLVFSCPACREKEQLFATPAKYLQAVISLSAFLS